MVITVREENIIIIILSGNQILQPLKLIIQTSVRMKPWKFDHLMKTVEQQLPIALFMTLDKQSGLIILML